MVGSDADLIIVDLALTRKVTREMVYSSAGWSIYERWEMKGWPIMTILRGNLMMEWPAEERRAKIVSRPIGRYIPRKPGCELYPVGKANELSDSLCTI